LLPCYIAPLGGKVAGEQSENFQSKNFLPTTTYFAPQRTYPNNMPFFSIPGESDCFEIKGINIPKAALEALAGCNVEIVKDIEEKCYVTPENGFFPVKSAGRYHMCVSVKQPSSGSTLKKTIQKEVDKVQTRKPTAEKDDKAKKKVDELFAKYSDQGKGHKNNRKIRSREAKDVAEESVVEGEEQVEKLKDRARKLVLFTHV
jgi:hypothetical protein